MSEGKLESNNGNLLILVHQQSSAKHDSNAFILHISGAHSAYLQDYLAAHSTIQWLNK